VCAVSDTADPVTAMLALAERVAVALERIADHVNPPPRRFNGYVTLPSDDEPEGHPWTV
jgi:hypothetical protein